MPDWLNGIAEQFKQLTPARQATLVATALGSLAFFFWMSNGAANSQYRLLFRGLDEGEVAAVVDALAAENIAHRLEEAGTAIHVPAALVHEARIRVAAKGLPAGRGVGFEIFDKGNFGVTDFVQKVNYKRAMQGELARSIEQVESVEAARVQIALPEKTVFLRKNQAHVTASVVARLSPGRDLSEDQVEGIVHLVASSVEGLQSKNVTVVDNHGRLLAPIGSGPPGPNAPDGALAQQSRLEASLEGQVVSLLERTIGIGNVSAQVTAELDWTKVEQTEERFDPDSQVARSERISEDSSSDALGGAGEAGGPAGVVANAPDTAVAGGGGGGGRQSASNRTTSTINYEINKVVSHTELPMGTIKRLSVAVLIDGMPVAPGGKPGEGGGEGASGFRPWDEKAMGQFEQLAKAAVGFSEERGDEFSLINAPFRTIAVESTPGWFDPQVTVLISNVLNIVGLLLALVMFGRFMVKPIAEALEGEASPQMVGVTTAGDLASQLELDAELEQEEELPQRELTLQERVDSLAAKRSEDSVKTIRSWLAG
ncbi:MAG: flagellar basal-body MS-ring/collar protein FliF [Myxococcota bacterium]|nr:flagellar basal-body MS-ring/collar protein FliF [Myxococcota bacterium]